MARVTSFQSPVLLEAAGRFCERAANIELEDHPKPKEERRRIEMEDMARSCIMHAAVAVAAAPVDLRFGVVERMGIPWAGKDDDLAPVRQALEQGWPERWRDQYDLLSKLLNLRSTDWGRRPGQDVALLFKVRNALVHPQPREAWASSDPNQDFEPARLEVQLGSRLEPHSWYRTVRVTQDRQMLSGRFASWAVTSAASFLVDYWKELDAHPSFVQRSEKVLEVATDTRQRLNPLYS